MHACRGSGWQWRPLASPPTPPPWPPAPPPLHHPASIKLMYEYQATPLLVKALVARASPGSPAGRTTRWRMTRRAPATAGAMVGGRRRPCCVAGPSLVALGWAGSGLALRRGLPADGAGGGVDLLIYYSRAHRGAHRGLPADGSRGWGWGLGGPAHLPQRATGGPTASQAPHPASPPSSPPPPCCFPTLPLQRHHSTMDRPPPTSLS
jgi:hypothetical protein